METKPASVETKPAIDLDRAREVVDRFQHESTKWLYGLDDAARILSWAFFTLLPYTDKLSQGKLLRQPHLMFRGPTGTGKTDLVSACAMAVDAKFERIQGLPTYMPEDILGYETIVEELDGTRKIHFKPGKLMAHIVLIDEDNRLSGKTKAAVLEGMEESSATLSSDYGNLAEGKMLPLFPLSGDFNDIEGPRFFMVICTENIFGEEEGTFANPVAQLDRTTLSINMLDPDLEEDELKISAHNVVGKHVEKLTNLYEVLDIARYIFDNVKISEYGQQYKVRLLRNTRPHRAQGRVARTVKEYVRVGISPRVHFHLEAVARTFAFFNGDTVITPDHIKAVAEPVLAHRLVLKEGMEFSVVKEELLQKIIQDMEVPPWK
ncbi:MAG: AAA family ATPase [Acidobacteria bacterium]|nr:AAA family ATPase [Acidobacteriota bacterium]